MTNAQFELLFGEVRSQGAHMDRLEAKIDGLETRFDGLDTRITRLETRIGALEQGIGISNQALLTLLPLVEGPNSVYEQFERINARLDHLEAA